MTNYEAGVELIERYVREVGERLPRKQRADVQAELRSLLRDALEERSAETGRPVEEATAVEVLKQFGKPEEVAARYAPPQGYLIGPRLYPAYLVTIQVTAVVVALFLPLSYLLQQIAGPGRLPSGVSPTELWGWVETFFRLLIMNLALATLVFAVIERFSKPEEDKKKEEAWDPRKLPSLTDAGRISPGGLVAKIYVIVVLMVVFNFLPQWFGVVFVGGREGIRAITLQEMGIYLPPLLMNTWWVLALALNMWVLKQGRWNQQKRWMEFVLGVFGAVILAFVLFSGPASPWSVYGLEALRNRGLQILVGKLIPFILFASLVGTLFTAGRRLHRLLKASPNWRVGELL